MKISITVDVGTEKDNCLGCNYFTNGGAYCQLFRARLPQGWIGDEDPKLVINSCEECLKAKSQPGLFDRQKIA